MLASLQFNAFNESEYNFTTPFNSTIGNLENTNASRHFAEEPLAGYDKNNLTLILLIFAAVFITCTCTGLVLAMLIYNGDGRLIRRHQNGNVVPVVRPDLLTLYRGTMGEGGLYGHFGDETQTIETPSSIYPGDMLPSFSDSSGKEKLFSDTITTPLSNNSIITMTMRNNHLIVETEERIPVSCSMLNSTELYTSILENPHAYASPDMDDYPSNDVDDVDSYSSEPGHNAHLCSVRAHEDRGPFYEATTSRQADEEDQHIELFHKNILAFPSHEREATACCSYEYGQPSHSEPLPPSTGLTQSDLTGSSCSTSRRAHNNYGYGNQSEYVLPQFPLRKHSSSFKLSSGSDDKRALMVSAYSSPYLHRSGHHQDSVLQLTDCSSSEFSEPSK